MICWDSFHNQSGSNKWHCSARCMFHLLKRAYVPQNLDVTINRCGMSPSMVRKNSNAAGISSITRQLFFNNVQDFWHAYALPFGNSTVHGHIAHLWMIYLLKRVIFRSYVSFLKGIMRSPESEKPTVCPRQPATVRHIVPHRSPDLLIGVFEWYCLIQLGISPFI